MDNYLEEENQDIPPVPTPLQLVPAEQPKRPIIPHLPLEKAKKFIQESGGSASKSSSKNQSGLSSNKQVSEFSAPKSPWSPDYIQGIRGASPIYKNTNTDPSSNELLKDIESFLKDIKKQANDTKSMSSVSYRERLNEFRKELSSNMPIDKPKKSDKKVQSRLLSHLKPEIKEDKQELNKAINRITVKDIRDIKTITNPNASTEILGILYLILFKNQIPRFHPWEAFVNSIAQPGLVVQKLRALPFWIDSKEISDDAMFQIKQISSTIAYYEIKESKVMTLLYEIIVELTKFCKSSNLQSEISKETTQLSSKTLKSEHLSENSKSPRFSFKTDQLEIPFKPKFTSKSISPPPELTTREVLESNNSQLIKKLIKQENEIVVKLRGAQKKAI